MGDKKVWKCKKAEELQLHPSTAYNRLKKTLMFNMAQLLEMDWCFQCGARIEEENQLSVEHMVPWQGSEKPQELFYDLTNIAFSHRGCNSKAARKPALIPCPSPASYFRGCRCDDCRAVYSQYRKDLQLPKS